MALVANRRGDFAEAQRILADMAQTLEAMAPGNQAIAALAGELRREQEVFADALSPLDAKRRHFESYAVNYSRAPEGKARRRGQPTLT